METFSDGLWSSVSEMFILVDALSHHGEIDSWSVNGWMYSSYFKYKLSVSFSISVPIFGVDSFNYLAATVVEVFCELSG